MPANRSTSATTATAAIHSSVLPRARLSFSLDPAADVVAGQRTPTDETEHPQPRIRHPFGTQDTWRWTIQAGGAVDMVNSDNVFGLAGVGLSYFIADDFSLNFQFNGLFTGQEGDNAGGFNFNLLGRWHFYAQETWSLYLDGGAGVLLTINRTPSDGSNFNFTPQFGTGISFDVGTDARMLLGVRWHHISNANTFRSNPGRDSIMLYAALSFPF